jgi:hypothetical protein
VADEKIKNILVGKAEGKKTTRKTYAEMGR